MRPIFLIGFMCSGKTTLGRALSKVAGIPFIDLDHYIEDTVGMTVKEIFATRGEAEFRRLESQALQECADSQDVIVACGGGTPCQPGAMELMNSRGITVRLVPNDERLVHRLMAGKRKRPLLAGIDTPQAMLDFYKAKSAEREQYYSKAMHTFDSTLLESDCEVAISVDEFRRRFLSHK